MRLLLATGCLLGLTLAMKPTSVAAQSEGAIGSLGGYRAMAGGLAATPGGTSVPAFGGRFGAVLPATGLGGGGIAFQSRPEADRSGSRSTFRLDPPAGELNSGSGRRRFALQEIGPTSGLGLGSRRTGSLMPASRPGVMPPSFAAPFRQPPSLLSDAIPGL